jgi:hypothetical protein
MTGQPKSHAEGYHPSAHYDVEGADDDNNDPSFVILARVGKFFPSTIQPGVSDERNQIQEKSEDSLLGYHVRINPSRPAQSIRYFERLTKATPTDETTPLRACA